MYVIIKPPNRPSYRRSVNTPDGIATALFEMALVGQKLASINPDDADEKRTGLGYLEIKSLEDLLEVLQTAEELAPELVEDADLSRLPMFGGEEILHGGHGEVWSWDPERVLVGRCISEMRIVERSGVEA